jgi:enediyne biosynthesis protein E4
LAVLTLVFLRKQLIISKKDSKPPCGAIMPNRFFALLFCIAICACQRPEQPSAPPLFQLLRKDATGLDFENELHQTSKFNVFNYMYFYNGGGVAAGDFNGDGLADLYFTSNMGPNKMFLNQGGLKFRDVTDASGVAGCSDGGCGWSTGISVVDLNNDGLLDLYVGQLGDYQGITGKNQLFICQKIENGIPVYRDEAAAYGLDLVGFSTQAVFFDYDLDGDLDVFQMNHSLHQNGTFGPRKNFEGKPHPLAGDRLLRNDSSPQSGPTFTDVTASAGIINDALGYGLGIVTGDVNNDGWPDLYIGNDFHENDYLYLNNQDGTFSESATYAMAHTSQFSMGVDMADVNNDGWTDIFSLDMLPEDPYVLKSSLGEDAYNVFRYKIGLGYAYQYTRNNLQLNNGDGTFCEIGLFAGLAATDWSWSSLFTDFDNDGRKDLFVSNGIPRRMNDIDYVRFQENRELALKGDSRDVQEHELAAVDSMPRIKLANKLFRNGGQLRFEDLSDRVSGSLPTFSNGAVVADFDNDGDLDVVVNNIEDEPFIYQNLARESGGSAGKYLSFKFEGQAANRHGIGAKVLVFRKNGERQVEEFYPVRGYQSSAHLPLHIGVGGPADLDSVLLIWPDRSFERVADLKFDQTQTLVWRADLPRFDFKKIRQRAVSPFRFADVTTASGLNFQHLENPFVEFNREPLMPNMVSTEGPALAVGDVNGDGLDDVFFGSAKRENSALFLQNRDGKFTLKTPPAILQDAVFEDVDAVFADLDGDGDLDLVVAAGGNEYNGQEEPMRQRAYLNDGHGNLARADPFPTLFMTAACVEAADFDGDGRVDFFFGGRALPWKYGLTPNSYLMRNLGNGQFEDATQRLAPGLQNVGLVKNATWADLDGDGDADLLLAMEWGPLTVFLNTGGRFEKKELDTGKGWWNFVLAHDFDGDGDVDILAGNTGLNGRLRPSQKEPIRLYINDFDNNGQTETVLTYYLKGREIPFANHEEILKALPMLKKKYLQSKPFAAASVPQIFGKDRLEKAVLREADTFESRYFENTGNLNFRAHALPDELQFSTLNAAALADLDGDGKMEVLLGGNFYDCNIQMGRYDASSGNVLRIGPGGQMQACPLGDLRLADQTRRIQALKIKGKTAYVWARNNTTAVIVQPIK